MTEMLIRLIIRFPLIPLVICALCVFVHRDHAIPAVYRYKKFCRYATLILIVDAIASAIYTVIAETGGFNWKINDVTAGFDILFIPLQVIWTLFIILISAWISFVVFGAIASVLWGVYGIWVHRYKTTNGTITEKMNRRGFNEHESMGQIAKTNNRK